MTTGRITDVTAAPAKRYVPGKAATKADKVALLSRETDALRTELRAVRGELAEARRAVDEGQAAQLRDANEQLVACALQAKSVAQAAVTDLHELTLASQRDALTETPNRALMLDRMARAIGLARRHTGRVAVLFLDLDHFKAINDSLGHAVGDDVLKLVARRVESVIRGSDTVSRHGGDEFLVLLPEITGRSSAALVAAKILSALAVPARVGDRSLRVSASVGISIYPEDGEDPLTLIRLADAAMYLAKNGGGRGFGFHGERRSGDGEAGKGTGLLLNPPSVERVIEPAGQEPRLRKLREANEQLIISALSAQDREELAKVARRRQTELAAMVVRQLRSPLTPLCTAAGLLKQSFADKALCEHIQLTITTHVAHMSRMVDSLLDGLCIGAGEFRLVQNDVDLAEVLRHAATTCRQAMRARRQMLRMRLPDRSLRVRGDASRLTQIFSNLLDNAVKFSRDGSATEVVVTTIDQSIVCTLADSGIGIGAESLPMIFDLFFQEARALPLRDGGLGVGLAIARDLVEAHGGTVVASSAGADRGSEFVVTLPMAQEATTAS